MEANAKMNNVEMSPKFAREVALAIKGKTVEKARVFLTDVTEMKQHVELKRHNKEVGHKKGVPARYPIKVANYFLKILKNAEENAKYKGADEKKLFIDKVEVYRGYHKRTMGAKSLGKAKVRGRRASVILKVKEMEKK